MSNTNTTPDAETKPEPKEALFLFGTQETIAEFPANVRRSIGFAIWEAQCGTMARNCKPLKGFGGGVIEVVAEGDGTTFRTVYLTKIADMIVVVDAFQKKSATGIKTQTHIIDRIKRRIKVAEQQHRERGAE